MVAVDVLDAEGRIADEGVEHAPDPQAGAVPGAVDQLMSRDEGDEAHPEDGEQQAAEVLKDSGVRPGGHRGELGHRAMGHREARPPGVARPRLGGERRLRGLRRRESRPHRGALLRRLEQHITPGGLQHAEQHCAGLIKRRQTRQTVQVLGPVKLAANGDHVFSAVYQTEFTVNAISIAASPSGDVLFTGQFWGTLPMGQLSPITAVGDQSYYDIFLVEPDTGHIVYSVFKEVDFATSLLTGPYAETNFAEVFRAARDADEQEAARKEWLQYHLQLGEWDKAAELVVTAEEKEDLQYLREKEGAGQRP